MNNALESPLEALAINYLSFGFLTAVNNLWTWVAVLAGAVSYLLTIRKPVKAITTIPVITTIPDLVQTSHLHTTSAQPHVGSCCDTLEILNTTKNNSSHFSSTRKFTVHYEHDSCWDTVQIVDVKNNPCDYFSSTKGKFTEYCEEDDMADVSEGDSCRDTLQILDTKYNYSSYFSSTREWEWEGMLRMRILTGEEMGWYRNQNLTTIDGNVVRLWDGSRRASTSSGFVGLTS